MNLQKDATVLSHNGGFRRFTLAYCARTREDVETVLGDVLKAGAKIR
jgi:hypothetical protein